MNKETQKNLEEYWNDYSFFTVEIIPAKYSSHPPHSPLVYRQKKIPQSDNATHYSTDWYDKQHCCWVEASPLIKLRFHKNSIIHSIEDLFLTML